jgi:hypothetical protein
VITDIQGRQQVEEWVYIRLRIFPFVGIPAQILAYYPNKKLRFFLKPFHFLGFLSLENEVRFGLQKP